MENLKALVIKTLEQQVVLLPEAKSPIEVDMIGAKITRLCEILILL